MSLHEGLLAQGGMGLDGSDSPGFLGGRSGRERETKDWKAGGKRRIRWRGVCEIVVLGSVLLGVLVLVGWWFGAVGRGEGMLVQPGEEGEESWR